MQLLGSLFTLPRFVKEANVEPDNRGSEAEKPESTWVMLNSGKEDVMSCLMCFFLYVCFLNWLTSYLYNSQHFTACGPKSDLPEHTSIVFIVCQAPKQGLSKEQRQLRG